MQGDKAFAFENLLKYPKQMGITSDPFLQESTAEIMLRPNIA